MSVTSPEAVAGLVRPLVEGLEDEHAYVLHLNGARDLIAEPHLHSIGSARFTLIDPIKVLRDALRAGALAIILVHNHPTGRIMPSKQDLQITERLLEGCRAVGIPLLDHVILGGNLHHSMAENYEMMFAQ